MPFIKIRMVITDPSTGFEFSPWLCGDHANLFFSEQWPFYWAGFFKAFPKCLTCNLTHKMLHLEVVDAVASYSTCQKTWSGDIISHTHLHKTSIKTTLMQFSFIIILLMSFRRVATSLPLKLFYNMLQVLYWIDTMNITSLI